MVVLFLQFIISVSFRFLNFVTRVGFRYPGTGMDFCTQRYFFFFFGTLLSAITGVISVKKISIGRKLFKDMEVALHFTQPE